MSNRVWTTLLIGALAAALATPAAAQDGQGAVVRRLDEPVELNIQEQPILEALEQIASAATIELRMDESTLRWLPHGEQTRVSVQARNVSLRDALEAMLAPMNLTFEARADGVRITAVDALRRLGRRPSFAETRALSAIRNTVVEPGAPAIEQFRAAAQTPRLGFVWHVDEDARAEALARADSRRPCTGQQYLDMLTHGQGWTWYLWGTDLVVMPREMQTRRQLRRAVTVEYRNQPLIRVLRDLLGQADLELDLAPGALALLGEQTRESFTLLMADATVDQALEAISGATGLVFTPGAEAVHVSAGEQLQSSAAPPDERPRREFILIIRKQIDGVEMMIPIRSEDLPPQLAERLSDQARNERQRAIEQLLAEDGATDAAPASTQPDR